MSKVKIILLISLVVLIVITVWTWPSNDRIRIVFCDVGQGDGIIVTQGSFQMLIDTGPENNKMAGCLGRYLPFWDKSIEMAIITHWDNDHSGGLSQVMKNYQLETIYSSTYPGDINVQKIYTGNLAMGDIVKYGLIRLEVLNPNQYFGSDNDNSVVGLLSVKNQNFLLMGDVGAEVEQKLVWRGVLRQGFGTLNILKVSHHGSAEGTSDELLDSVKPTEAIISVGRNSFGHPTKQVLDKLNERNIRIRRTDREGDVVIKID